MARRHEIGCEDPVIASANATNDGFDNPIPIIDNGIISVTVTEEGDPLTIGANNNSNWLAIPADVQITAETGFLYIDPDLDTLALGAKENTNGVVTYTGSKKAIALQWVSKIWDQTEGRFLRKLHVLPSVTAGAFARVEAETISADLSEQPKTIPWVASTRSFVKDDDGIESAYYQYTEKSDGSNSSFFDNKEYLTQILLPSGTIPVAVVLSTKKVTATSPNGTILTDQDLIDLFEVTAVGGQNPEIAVDQTSVVYETNGTYQITFTATNEFGSTATTNTELTIN